MSQRKSNRQPARGVGISKAGYQLPPVALPGLTKQERLGLKTTSSGSIPKFKGTQSIKDRLKNVGSKATPGRMFSQQGLWMATGVAQNMLQNSLNQSSPGGYDWADNITNIVTTGASMINPLLGAVAGPILGAIVEPLKAAREKEKLEMYQEAEKDNCIKFKKEAMQDPRSQAYAELSYQECMGYKKEIDKASAQDAAAATCEKIEITPEMLEGKTIEQLMKEYNITPAKS